MTDNRLTPDEEYDFYARPENQEPQGPPRRRTVRLTAPIPVRIPPELLEEIRRRAADERPGCRCLVVAVVSRAAVRRMA